MIVSVLVIVPLISVAQAIPAHPKIANGSAARVLNSLVMVTVPPVAVDKVRLTMTAKYFRLRLGSQCPSDLSPSS